MRGRRAGTVAVGVAALLLGGCTGVGVREAPAEGRATYQVWGLNEASSELTGADRTVVLNGDLDHDSEAFFQVEGTWRDDGFVLADESAARVRDLAGRLPERTGDPGCRRLVLVDDGFLADRAVAVVDPQEAPADGPVTATPLDPER